MSRPLRLLTRFAGTSRAIRKHTEEETGGFAADILRKLRKGGTVLRAAN